MGPSRAPVQLERARSVAIACQSLAVRRRKEINRQRQHPIGGQNRRGPVSRSAARHAIPVTSCACERRIPTRVGGADGPPAPHGNGIRQRAPPSSAPSRRTIRRESERPVECAALPAHRAAGPRKYHVGQSARWSASRVDPEAASGGCSAYRSQEIEVVTQIAPAAAAGTEDAHTRKAIAPNPRSRLRDRR